MSQELTGTALIVGMVTAVVFFSNLGVGEIQAMIYSIPVGLLTMAFWWFSPLPNRTGSGQIGAGYWGFKTPSDIQRRDEDAD